MDPLHLSLKECFIDFVRQMKWYLVIIGIVIYLCYGFMAYSVTFNNDISYFNHSRFLFAFQQGRWGFGLLALLGFTNVYLPFWNASLGMLLFYFASFVLGITIYGVSQKKVSSEAIFVFMVLFVSSPLHFEQFVYPAALILHSFAFIWGGYACFVLFQKEAGWINIIIGGFFLAWSWAIYEIYVFVSCMLICLLFLLQYTYLKQNFFSGNILKNISTGVGIASFYYIFGRVLSYLFLGSNEGPAREILWFSKELGIKEILGKLIYFLGYDYLYNGLFYFAIFMFVVSLILWGDFCITKIHLVRYKLFYFLIVLGCLFGLSFITGKSIPYRTAQTFTVFIAFSWMLIWNEHKKWGYWKWMILFVVVFYQCKEINIWSFYDYKVNEKNIADMRQIGYDIQKKFGRYPEKKIILCNGYGYEQFSRFIQTLSMQRLKGLPRHSYVNQHAGLAYLKGDAEQTLNLFKEITGLQVYQDNERRVFYEKWLCEQNKPGWPERGYITENDDCILVNLGNPPRNENHTITPLEFIRKQLK